MYWKWSFRKKRIFLSFNSKRYGGAQLEWIWVMRKMGKMISLSGQWLFLKSSAKITFGVFLSLLRKRKANSIINLWYTEEKILRCYGSWDCLVAKGFFVKWRKCQIQFMRILKSESLKCTKSKRSPFSRAPRVPNGKVLSPVAYATWRLRHISFEIHGCLTANVTPVYHFHNFWSKTSLSALAHPWLIFLGSVIFIGLIKLFFAFLRH